VCSERMPVWMVAQCAYAPMGVRMLASGVTARTGTCGCGNLMSLLVNVGTDCYKIMPYP